MLLTWSNFLLPLFFSGVFPEHLYSFSAVCALKMYGIRGRPLENGWTSMDLIEIHAANVYKEKKQRRKKSHRDMNYELLYEVRGREKKNIKRPKPPVLKKIDASPISHYVIGFPLGSAKLDREQAIKDSLWSRRTFRDIGMKREPCCNARVSVPCHFAGFVETARKVSLFFFCVALFSRRKSDRGCC